MADPKQVKKGTIPSEIRTTRQFGAALTELRERAGLSVRQVAQEVGAARTTVGDYFAGKSLPSPATSWVLPKILVRCGVDDPEVLEEWERALLRARRAPGPAPAGSPCPYRGLASFQPDDAEWFHGRKDLVTHLVRQVRTCRDVPLFVLGQSGAGKSSLLGAGLVARFRDDEQWQTVLVNAGSSDFQLPERTSEFLLVVVDQFEELFTTADQDPEFVDTLFAVAERPDVAVVLGMRSDFYDHAVGHPKLAGALQHETVVVGAMSEDELRSAIVRPAQQAGVDIEDGLVELLLRDFRPADSAGGGALPLLSHVLRATWQAGNRRTLTIDGYLSTGGIASAVGQSADSVYLGLAPHGQQLARSLLLRLVHIGDGAADTRRWIAKRELPAECLDILDRFVAQRLVTIDADTISISHEALVHAWRRLREWLDADRDTLRAHRRLQSAAQSWAESRRDPGALYRGALLESAAALAESIDLSEVERDFVTAGLDARRQEERDKRRQIQRLRRWVAALVVAVLVAAGLVAVVFELRSDAVTERNIAVSRQTALRADTLRSSDPALAGQLALAAYRIAPTPEARSSLLESGHTPAVSRARGSDGTLATALTSDGRTLTTGGADGTARLWRVSDRQRLSPLSDAFDGAPGSIFGAAINPADHMLALTGMNRGLTLWDITNTRHPQRLPAPEPALTGTGYALAFSPDGQYFAVAGQDGLRLWHTDTTGAPRQLVLTAGLGGDGKAVAFSDDSTTLAASGLGNTLYLWRLDGDIPSGGPAHEMPGAVNGLAFHPDGHTLAIACSDREVHLWDLDKSTEDTPFTGFVGPVYTVGFSDDGRRLAAGSADSSTLIWELPGPHAPQSLPHPGPVTTAAFLPGTHALLTASADGFARLWSLPGGVIPGHPGPISTVAFGPHDQTLVVSASSVGDGPGSIEWTEVTAARRTPAPPIEDPEFTGASALSPNGRLLATGGADGTTRLWRVDGRRDEQATSLTGPKQLIESVAFNNDATLLAVGSDDHRVYLWDVRTPRSPHLLATMTEPANIVMTVAFSHDGRELAAASVDNNAYLWNITRPTSPKPAERISGHTNYAYAVSFSPNDRVLAVGSADKTVTLWNIDAPGSPTMIGRPLTGPANYVYGVTFTTDGSLLAAASTDGTVWLWEITDPAHPRTHATLRTESSLYSVAVSKDGKTLAAGDADGTAHLWPLAPETVARQICADAGDLVSHAEWTQFIPDLEYRAPCT